MEKGNRVAIYGRVSTGEQSVDMQVSELTDYAQNRGWLIVDRYLDCGVSGSKESRPALNRLMNDARQRKFDILLVWKIDRFGRSLKHLVNSLAELENVGVAFISLRDSLDLSSPAGRLMAQLLGAISEFERSLIAESVRAGLQECQAQRQTVGKTSSCRRSR
jgi:DNA invertase Pin-like site-specific DNA recombinase